MIENKRSYYRNWYHHWQLEKEKEEKLQAMMYFSEQDLPEPQDRYRANHELSRQYANVGMKGRQSEYKASSKKTTSRNKIMVGEKIIRGIFIAVPAIFVFLTLLYSAGVIPQETINRLLNVNEDTLVMTYLTQHGEVMDLHNEMNQSLESYVTNGSLTSEFQNELQTKHLLVQEETELLLSYTGSEFSNMNRLWRLKLTSLDEMVNYVLINGETSPEVIDYYHQFVQDQNEIGEEISLDLVNLLTNNNINYLQQIGGDIQLLN